MAHNESSGAMEPPKDIQLARRGKSGKVILIMGEMPRPRPHVQAKGKYRLRNEGNDLLLSQPAYQSVERAK